MSHGLTRRDLLKSAAAQCLTVALAGPADAAAIAPAPSLGWVRGKMTGAQAVVETLTLEGVACVFGIPGAQANELWDAFKQKCLTYVLVTHEFSAACMADGHARATGKVGVVCIVPGPGITNALTGLGEALLDGIPIVAIVCDVAKGCKQRPFQVHDLPNIPLLQPVTKGVFPVDRAADIPLAIRQAFALARSGEPGPAAVVIPYPLLIDSANFDSPPITPDAPIVDEQAFQTALALLSDCHKRVGIYVGMPGQDCSHDLARIAELLQAPVASNVSGKGAIPDHHPLAVGWGYGPFGTRVAQEVFRHVDVVLAIGVRYSEVSTAYYNIPEHACVIQVDINPCNMGRVVRNVHAVQADAGVFLARLLQHGDCLRRPANGRLLACIQELKRKELWINSEVFAQHGVDQMAFLIALRRCLPADGLVFVDVTAAEHWAAEAFAVYQPRTYFNPTDNQSMGWSIPAAIGAQAALPCRQVVTITGDGCFLMSALEIATAARLGLPVKFFILDDQAYHYMQALQQAAYRRTTATVLPQLDYAAFAQAVGVGYHEIVDNRDLVASIRGVLCKNGPILVRVLADYGKRRIRWIDAAKEKFASELTTEQKIRFLTRIAGRSLQLHPLND